MNFIVQVNDKRLEITLPSEAKSGKAILNGQEINYDINPLTSKGSFSLIIDGHPHLVEVEPTGDNYQVQVNGVNYRVSTLDERRERMMKIAGDKKSTNVNLGAVRAPMPGLVVKLLTSPGATVRKGQGVIIIEAMKMENEISAPIDGIIDRILVQPGQAVEKDETLMIIKS